jgi:hypothetical protein
MHVPTGVSRIVRRTCGYEGYQVVSEDTAAIETCARARVCVCVRARACVDVGDCMCVIACPPTAREVVCKTSCQQYTRVPSHARSARTACLPAHSHPPLTHPHTCRIFMRTTSSLARSVPTNLACVTASAMFSIPLAAHGDDMSMSPYERNLLMDESATPGGTRHCSCSCLMLTLMLMLMLMR